MTTVVAADVATLDRWERLDGVRVVREALREAFGLELLLATSEGALAHQRGGVLTASCEACRVSLFSRDGFGRCDAFYRELAASPEPCTEECHLGLRAVSVPVAIEGVVEAHVVASGFVAPTLPSPGHAPYDPTHLARALHELDPHLSDPAGPVRAVLPLRGSAVESVRGLLRVASREIVAHEEGVRSRRSVVGGGSAGLPGHWGMIGASPRMREVFELLERVARSHSNVIVSGESGTGKELVARALHAHGPRARRPFVAQNCAAMADELLESTLFGHVKGAFSGAVRGTLGVFGAADRGTLFLDEVGDMSPALQVKLLRVLSDGMYVPVGGVEPRRADVRLIAASHKDLAELVERGTFRQDLYFRLHVVTIHLPALRDRPGDLPLLVQHLVAQHPSVPTRLSPAALACLERYRFPGNVRELASEVARWQITAAGAVELGPEHLSPEVRAAGGFSGERDGALAVKAAAGEGTLAEAVESLERALIARGLERTAGNRAKLARELDISRTTLNERIARYGLASDE
jgi:DNA-binding NtrC family response regulator